MCVSDSLTSHALVVRPVPDERDRRVLSHALEAPHREQLVATPDDPAPIS
jgi:hypothetical protein